MKPEITVFMAVYNGEKYLKQAIDSTLNQTFKDFELLIVDDGSTDDSFLIAKKYSDKRIRIVQNTNNKGLAFTRNRGIEEARGKYLATLDCDDISFKNRLATQMAFLSQNKDVAICGGKIKYIDEQLNYTGKLFSLRGDQDFLKTILMFNNIFFNSSTMINTSVLRKFHFEESLAPAEDFDLFEKIAAQYKIAFLNKWLSLYRVHNNNISVAKSEKRIAAEKIIAERQLVRYGFAYTADEFELHTKFTSTDLDFLINNLERCRDWFTNLINQNTQKKIFNSISFKLALSRQWLRLFLYQFKTSRSLETLFKKGKITYPELFNALVKSL